MNGCYLNQESPTTLTMKKSAREHLPPQNNLPSQDQLAYDQEVNRRAYELWEAAGGRHGDDLSHWLEANREVKAGHKLKDSV
jgi:hypothetical protein